MSIENDQQAAEALFQAIEADRSEQSGFSTQTAEHLTPPPAEQAPSEPVSGNDAEGTTEPAGEDSFTTKFRPDELPPELQTAYRSMQADYTRSKQDLAEERRQIQEFEQKFEPYGGISAAEEALNFVVALATDPDYQKQVHQQLSMELERQGLTPAQASAEASRQIETAVNDDDDLGFGLDPAAERKISTLEQEIAEMRKWREEQEEFAYQRSLQAELDRMHADVANANPTYKEGDWNRVYQLAYSTGGDLVAASDMYNSWKNEVVGEYVDTKATAVAPGITPLPSGHGVDVGRKFTDLNDPELDRLAMERLAHELARGG